MTYTCVYVYIYIYRERERETDIYIYISSESSFASVGPFSVYIIEYVILNYIDILNYVLANSLRY